MDDRLEEDWDDNYGEPCPCCGYDLLPGHQCRFDDEPDEYEVLKPLSNWDLMCL